MFSTLQVTGVGFEVRTGFVTVNGVVADKESQPAIAKVLQVGVLCNNSHIENGQVLGQATEGALLVAGKKIGLDDLRGVYGCRAVHIIQH
jgi:magnesium-transporting ATPase (P-type)